MTETNSTKAHAGVIRLAYYRCGATD